MSEKFAENTTKEDEDSQNVNETEMKPKEDDKKEEEEIGIHNLQYKCIKLHTVHFRYHIIEKIQIALVFTFESFLKVLVFPLESFLKALVFPFESFSFSL